MRAVLFIAALTMFASCKLRSLASVVAFEGEIDMSMSTSMAPASGTTTKFEMKGSKMRMETSGLGAVVSITDADAKKTWVIDNTSRTYSELDLTKLGSLSTTTTKPKSKVTKKGSDKVAGYSCDIYEVDDASMQTEVCVASGFSMMVLGLSGPFSVFAAGNDAWSEVLSHGFPLRMLVSAPGGPPIMKMEATHIEKKSLPDSEFAIPAGYTKTASPI
jgi:hypothetical protein